MNGSHSLLTKFLKPKIRLGAILRGVIVAAFSMVTTTGIIYVNYIGYWKGTIYRTQTVDFNILANLLPRKISSQLLSKDIKGLQKSLDSNYGLFGIIITNCKSIKISCPNQKIIYASKAKIEEVDGYKRKLISKENYTFSWLQKLNNADFLEAELRSELFIPLYNPPAIEQTWEFTTPRESNIVYSKQINQGEVIGRIYLLRAEPPLFAEELRQWLHNPWSMSSKILAYNAIALAALLTGLFVWLLSEILYSLNVETEKKLRISAENEAKILKEKIEAEEAVKIAEKDRHIAIENELKAVQEKQAAEEAALVATQKGEQAIQEKQAAQEAARAAVLKSEQAIQEKQAAEEAALIAIREREEARKHADYLYDSIQEQTRELVIKDEDSRIETSEPHYHHSFEVIHQSSQSPLTLDIIIQHRTFFEWIDSEIRSTYDVDSWLKSYPQFRSLVKENSNGQICLNDLGTLLNCAVNEIFDDRPRLKWPKGVALPPSKKYGISLEPHHRPRGWEKFVNDLCEIDCVRRVAYDNCGYGGSDIKVVDADSGTIACRYGPVGTCLPLRIDTTARGKEQTELVIEYIRKYIQ